MSRKLSTYISLILRHKPEIIGLELDKEGYLNVDELIEGVKLTGRNIDLEKLKNIVNKDEKGRYSFNKSGDKIRANQGHSIEGLDLGLEVVKDFLTIYHGTSKSNSKSIKERGLLPMSREFVHLTADLETAKKVGSRHGNEVLVYSVNVKKMLENKMLIFKSKNNVYLSKHIPFEYLKEHSHY